MGFWGMTSSPLTFFLSFLFVTTSLQAHVGKVACRYYDRDQIWHTSARHPELPWVWARGENSEKINVSGSTSEGFFVADEVYGDVPSSKHFYLPSMSKMREFCQNGIEHDFPDDKGKIIIEIGVKNFHLAHKHQALVLHERSAIVDIDRVVVFGDSASEQGYLKRKLRAFPPEPYFAGRFSNGPVWVDYLSMVSGLPIQNWAVGGSVSRKFSDFSFDNHKFAKKIALAVGGKISGCLRREVNRYHRKSLLNNSCERADRTLYIIWIGGNDYYNPLSSTIDTDTYIDKPDDKRIGSNTVIDRVIENIEVNIETLYELGARKFMVVNQPDLGIAPKMATNRRYHSYRNESREQRALALSEAFSAISARHNQLLSALVKKLRKKHEDIIIDEMDLHTSSDRIFKASSTNPLIKHAVGEDYAETVTHNGRSVVINKACFYGAVWQAGKRKVCKNPDDYLFWDGIHPSTYSHCLFAYFIHEQIARTHKQIATPELKNYLALCKPSLIDKI